MSLVPYERRVSLRGEGWFREDMAEVWTSGDGQLVKTFLPDGREVEARHEHKAGCDSIDRGPDGIVKPCNCKLGPL